jgi:hypothetical protein
MKKIIALLFTSILFISCDPNDTENVSRVTHYPTVTLNGESLIILNQGAAYSEAGAIALAGTETLATTTDGSVDVNTPGVYKLVYSALNSDGFAAKAIRTVVVISTTPSSIDLSGTFKRGSNINIVTRISDRKYVCDNATGYTTGNANNLTLVFYNLDDTKIYAPFQENASATGISAESNVGTIVNVNKWFWVINASGFFGPSIRTFVRI